MRVIAGTHRGRRLRGPEGFVLRPTSDRVREALFSILGNRLPRSRFLDLYAGTGAVGIEALSRGAMHVTSVESSAGALQLLRRNVSECRMAHQMTIHPKTVKQFLGRPDRWSGPYDIVFVDPPYSLVHELQSLFDDVAIPQLFADDSWMVVEHAEKTTLPTHLGRNVFLRSYLYGDTALSVFSSVGVAQS